MIKDKKGWAKVLKNNQDDYGKACVDVARQVMVILDKDEDIGDPHSLICRACEDVDEEGITGFMAGAVASIVSGYHSRGEDFRKVWNIANQIGTEGEKANKGKGVINPAILNIGDPE